MRKTLTFVLATGLFLSLASVGWAAPTDRVAIDGVVVRVPGPVDPARVRPGGSWSSATAPVAVPAPVTVVADSSDQGDVVVDHSQEPYTVEVACGGVAVDASVVTAILVEVGVDGAGPVLVDGVNWWTTDVVADSASVAFPTASGSYHWVVSVVVNGASQVSVEQGQVTCP